MGKGGGATFGGTDGFSYSKTGLSTGNEDVFEGANIEEVFRAGNDEVLRPGNREVLRDGSDVVLLRADTNAAFSGGARGLEGA